MIVSPCPEGYSCTVQKLVSVGDLLLFLGGGLVLVALVVLFCVWLIDR